MRDHRARRLAGLAALAAAAALVVARGAQPLTELLEGLGVLDPYRPDTGPGPVDVEQLVARVADLEERLRVVEHRWAQFDRNWPEPYRHATATAAFDRLGGAQ